MPTQPAVSDSQALASPYAARITAELPRLFSMLDRQEHSKSYGCLDRTHWCWKFTDFPGARFQEGAYALAAVATLPFPGNRYAGLPQAEAWATAALLYWSRIQHADGSFDEAYPHEQSLAATAVSAFHAAEAFRRLQGRLSVPQRNTVESALRKAGRWLCRSGETHGILTNHLAAAGALHHAGELLAERDFLQRRDHFLEIILKHQSAEGWLHEYGGADPGYQTLGMFYLARIWQQSREGRLLTTLKRASAFLLEVIHPDRTLGGETGSRDTEFFFPAAFEILAPHDPQAAAIAAWMRPAVADQQAAGLAAMDPYNFFPMLNNYLFAQEAAGPIPAQRPAFGFEREGERHFAEAGLLVKSTPRYFAILGLSKGGVLKAWDRTTGQPVIADGGYAGLTRGGELVSSLWLQHPGEAGIENAGNSWRIQKQFRRLPRKTFSPGPFFLFRLFNLTIGRLPAAALWLKRLLVGALLYRHRTAPIALTRTIALEPDWIEVVDHLISTASRPLPMRWLRRPGKFSVRHMGSSRYFQPTDLSGIKGSSPDLSDDWNRNGELRLRYRFPFGAGR